MHAVLVALLLLAAVTPNVRDAQLADLEAAKQNYVMRSLAFTPQAKAQALQSLASLEQRAGTLSNTEFLVGIAQLAALANNGHDGLDFGTGAWMPQTRLPFRMMWFPDAMIVSRASPQYADLLGARVLAIDGRSPDDLFNALHAVDGGTAAYRSWDAEWAVEYADVLNALGLATSPDRLDFTFVLRNGHEVQRDIAMVPRAGVPSATMASRLWAPQPFGAETAEKWRAANADVNAPLYLQQPDRPFRVVYFKDRDLLYVQLRSNADSAGYKVSSFVQEVTQQLSQHPHYSIVDLRFDTGGDITRTIELMRLFPAETINRVYLLTGRYTFSAGIVSSAALKHAGGSRVTIVGEDVGDNLRWWSEGSATCLPNSHLCLHVTTGLWDLAKGCIGEPHCYGDKFDAIVGELNPDLPAPLTARAWLRGDDPGLDAIQNDITANWPRTSSGHR